MVRLGRIAIFYYKTHAESTVHSNLLESMSGIIPSTSLFDPDVPISVHPALDVLGFLLAHVVILVA